MMTLSIRLDSTGTHADVSQGEEGDADGAYRLQPGETYLSIPYDLWRSHAGQRVNVGALQRRSLWEDHGETAAPGPAAAAPAPAGWRGLLRPPSSLGEGILIHGILGFGIPMALLSAVIRELVAPGYDPVRFKSSLLVKLLTWGLTIGPLVGAFTWSRAKRERTGG
ncbi:MAG TPA: hypothetical protein VFT45_23965 [Longimicrobium sp.]|nr:hypothetical protein [Longimicrobium sp.]